MIYDEHSWWKPLFPISPWKEQYAYFPKKINNRWVWLDKYYTQIRYDNVTPYIVYGTIFDVLKGEVND